MSVLISADGIAYNVKKRGSTKWSSRGRYLLCSQMILTDFQGSAWKATFSLQDVQDSLVSRYLCEFWILYHFAASFWHAIHCVICCMLQEAYEPSEEQLLSWLQDAFSKTHPKLIREKGKLAGVEAMHGEGCADVRWAPNCIALQFSSGRQVVQRFMWQDDILLLSLLMHVWVGCTRPLVYPFRAR